MRKLPIEAIVSNSGHLHDLAVMIASVQYVGYLGDVVFAISGALMAARYRMDIVGFMLLGGITGMGGGTVRDLILDRTVFWLQNPFELLLCTGSASLVFFILKYRNTTFASDKKWLEWTDALGLAAFAVQGTHISMIHGAHVVTAAFLGVLSGVGGGLARDVICGQKPFVVSGEIYATAAFAGAATYLILLNWAGLSAAVVTWLGFAVVVILRGIGIQFGIRLGSYTQSLIKR